jgi:hypothetical protein
MHPVMAAVRGGKPVQFVWKRQSIVIEIIADHWRETGRWWEDEPVCDFYLVSTPGGAFLLCSNLTATEWHAKPVQ